ncbi:MAG TPA: cytochrome c-type biogenesis protein CcmH [Methylophilaceae bacterium]|nr:cytochrome c-type biogenesis protein CcmH [Methylophilaceae bacterium]
MTRVLILLVSVLLFCNLLAGEAKPLAQDPVLEGRLKTLSQELRCLVCQNQTLSESNAPLAEDLRNEIRQQMREGKSNQEVIDYLVARYGDFVRYRPPLKESTWLLWFGPFIGIIAGAGLLFITLKKRASNQEFEAEDI